MRSLVILSAGHRVGGGSVVRESAISAIIANLNASVIIKKVIRADDSQKLAATALPAVKVVDDTQEERLPKSGGYADVYFELRLIGLCRGVNQSTAMNALDVEIKKIINSDRTLGGLVANVTILARTETDLDGNESVSEFTRPIQVFYVANESLGE